VNKKTISMMRKYGAKLASQEMQESHAEKRRRRRKYNFYKFL